MSDALIGVIIGGLIAWVAPLITLRYGERRWRFEAKLNHLKTERDRFEKLYETTLETFGKSMAENAYSSNMTADFLVIMPKEIGDLFDKWMMELDHSESKMKVAYLGMASAMKMDLAKRDAEIRELLDERTS